LIIVSIELAKNNNNGGKQTKTNLTRTQRLDREFTALFVFGRTNDWLLNNPFLLFNLFKVTFYGRGMGCIHHSFICRLLPLQHSCPFLLFLLFCKSL